MKEQYASLLNEFNLSQKEKEELTQQLNTIHNNKQDEIIKDNQIAIATVPLMEYELLREEYLKSYSINQYIDYKEQLEYGSLMKLYHESNDSLASIKNSHDELKKKCEIDSNEIKERIDALNKDNDAIKEQLKAVSNQYTLSQFEIRKMKAKENKTNQRNNALKMKIKTIKKSNVALRKRFNCLKTKLANTRNESDAFIEKMKCEIEELEEKNNHLIHEKLMICKDVFKHFIKEIENYTLQFHYISDENRIEVYFNDEAIGEVKNQSSSIKRNCSNTIKHQQQSNESNRDRILLMNSLRRSCNYSQMNLRQMYSSSSYSGSSNNAEEEKTNEQLSCCLSYYVDKEMILTNNTLKRINNANTNYHKEITPFNIIDRDKDNEGYSISLVNISKESSFTLETNNKLKPQTDYSSLSQSNHNFSLRKEGIDNESIIHYINNNIQLNNTLTYTKNAKQIILKDNHKVNCLNCSVY